MSLRISQWHIATIVIDGETVTTATDGETVTTVTDGDVIATNVVSGNGGTAGIIATGTETGGRLRALIPA